MAALSMTPSNIVFGTSNINFLRYRCIKNRVSVKANSISGLNFNNSSTDLQLAEFVSSFFNPVTPTTTYCRGSPDDTGELKIPC